jgi:hypothetical protein
MTREKVKKELIPMLQAYVDGGIIQVMDLNGEWQDIKNPEFNGNIWEYRIKPEPKYRPFKSKEECWNELLKHEPFGWITDKKSDSLIFLTSIGRFHAQSAIYSDNFIDIFKNFNFIDGSPFGIREE